jgi:hypothetical protein
LAARCIRSSGDPQIIPAIHGFLLLALRSGLIRRSLGPKA